MCYKVKCEESRTQPRVALEKKWFAKLCLDLFNKRTECWHKEDEFVMQKKLTTKQRIFHFICFPIISFVSFYLLISLLSYFFKGRLLTSSEVDGYIVAGAIGLSIAHWFNLLYPSKPPSDSNKQRKSLKEYVKQYVTDGTPFNKLMIMIYSFCIIIVIVFIILGYL